jgi:hypothetical protein
MLKPQILHCFMYLQFRKLQKKLFHAVCTFLAVYTQNGLVKEIITQQQKIDRFFHQKEFPDS